MTTTSEYLRYATSKLSSNSIDTARLDSLILMEFVLKKDRAKILANPNSKISEMQKKVLNHHLTTRSRHIPIAQIIHKSEFYGRSFYINKNVLVPRPESEVMIDMLKSLIFNDPITRNTQSKQKPIYVADVGTGSGALGITAKLECPDIKVDLLDNDPKAINVAKKNVVLNTINANIIISDLLLSSNKNYDILLCNLPYVPDDFHINLAASHEPSTAIYGGTDGLDIYRKLFKSLSNIQHKPLYILSESLPFSHRSLAITAKNARYNLISTNDFVQLFKFHY